MNTDKYTTLEQAEIAREICEAHNLDPDQITFVGEENKPIFDYEAVCHLSLTLTDIEKIETSIIKRGENFVIVDCVVTLPDGRSRSIQESAYLDEPIGKDSTIDSLRLAEQVAQSRAARRGIRAVGINLYKAHKKMMETGEIAEGHTDHDPRYTDYQEIKVIAKKIGLIYYEEVNGKQVEKRQHYENLLIQNYQVKSLTELNDVQLQRCKILFRSLDRTGYGVSLKEAA